jgi:uncharacterized membrane protein YphA (DoxX/SURF4 family)
MNALFPELLFIGPYFAPLILRLALAGTLLFLAGGAFPSYKGAELPNQVRIALFGITGLLLLVGFATQLAALLALLLSIDAFFFKKSPLVPTSRLSLLLMMAISFALFFTGAGALAIDLPY